MSFGSVVGSGAGMGAAGWAWAAVSSLTLSSDALSKASSRSLVASVTAAATAAAAAVSCLSPVPRCARLCMGDKDFCAGSIRAVGAIDGGNNFLAALGRGVTVLASGSALSVSFSCLGETDSSHLAPGEPGRNNSSWLVDGVGDLAVLIEL
jgi:hypothetical protein